jgi:hypothetical protein
VGRVWSSGTDGYRRKDISVRIRLSTASLQSEQARDFLPAREGIASGRRFRRVKRRDRGRRRMLGGGAGGGFGEAGRGGEGD